MSQRRTALSLATWRENRAALPLQLCSLLDGPRWRLCCHCWIDDDVLYSIAFSFFGSQLRATLGMRIGCLQGPKGEDSAHRVREATRDLHGMRPKTLMARLVRQLGYEHGCRKMLLVGNINRAVHHSAKKGRLFADYNHYCKN